MRNIINSTLGSSAWFSLTIKGFTVIALMGFSASAFSQNPSFGGREFRRIFTDGTVPQGSSEGATVGEAYLAKSGVYFSSDGFYYVDDNGSYTVANKKQEDFKLGAFWKFLGFKDDESLMFVPGNFNNPYPVYVYGPSGLVAVDSPTPEQALNLGNYFDGRMVYYQVLGLAGAHVWYYEEGQPEVLLYNRDNLPGLNSYYDYDGESMALNIGEYGVDDAVWLRTADGSLKRIIGRGDPLPGSEGTYAGGTVHVNQGKVYILASSVERFPAFADQVLLSSDGSTIDLIGKVGAEIPGSGGSTLAGVELLQVTDGQMWLNVSPSTGGKALYRVENGIWTEVVSSSSSFDGRTAIALGGFPFGMRGDTAVVTVWFLNPNFSISKELYVNGDLPGFEITGGGNGPAMSIAPGPNGSYTLTVSTEAGKTYTLQSSTTLTGWTIEQAPISGDAGSASWTVTNSEVTQYFRVQVD